MTAANLIETLRNRGVTLTADTQTVWARPSDALTIDDRKAIKAHKAALLEILSHKSQDTEPRCRTCNGQLLTESGPGWKRSWCPSTEHRYSVVEGLKNLRKHLKASE